MLRIADTSAITPNVRQKLPFVRLHDRRIDATTPRRSSTITLGTRASFVLIPHRGDAECDEEQHRHDDGDHEPRPAEHGAEHDDPRDHGEGQDDGQSDQQQPAGEREGCV